MKIIGNNALDEAQVEELMRSSWTIRLATLGPGEQINLTALWFGWAGERVYAFTRGQKVENLRRNPSCTLLVDHNESYPELLGVMLQGRGRLLENAAEENGDEYLDSVIRDQMGEKYADGGFGDPANRRNQSTAMGRNWRWVVVSPDRCFSWDNRKLPKPKQPA